MNKFLRLSLVALFAILTLNNANAGEITIVPDAADISWSGDKNGFTTTYQGITIDLAKENSSSDLVAPTDLLKVYKGATLKFTSSVGNITKIEFTTSSTSYAGTGFSAVAPGALTHSGVNSTWAGDAASILFTAGNKQVRISRIVITYTAAAGVVEAPEISAADKFSETTNVTITAGEGTTIYYTTDGTEPTTESNLYSAPFAINATTTVKAIAVKGTTKSAVATETYNKLQPMTVAEAVAAAEALEAGAKTDYYAVMTGVISSIVTSPKDINNYKNADYFITDASGKEIMVFRGKGLEGANADSTTFVVGATVTISGKLQKYVNAESVVTLEIVENELIAYDSTTSGVAGVKAAANNSNGRVYNLAGQLVDETYKGVVIKDGKKVVLK